LLATIFPGKLMIGHVHATKNFKLGLLIAITILFSAFSEMRRSEVRDHANNRRRHMDHELVRRIQFTISSSDATKPSASTNFNLTVN
jgi:hypothetical protein